MTTNINDLILPDSASKSIRNRFKAEKKQEENTLKEPDNELDSSPTIAVAKRRSSKPKGGKKKDTTRPSKRQSTESLEGDVAKKGRKE